MPKATHADTAIALSQLRLVAGPNAREHGARAYFVAGNHDWKNDRDREGLEQLKHLEALIDAVRTRDGLNVRLVPAAGRGGPHVIDWGPHFRILLLDTAWWILQSSDTAQSSMLSRIERNLDAWRSRNHHRVASPIHIRRATRRAMSQ